MTKQSQHMKPPMHNMVTFNGTAVIVLLTNSAI